MVKSREARVRRQLLRRRSYVLVKARPKDVANRTRGYYVAGSDGHLVFHTLSLTELEAQVERWYREDVLELTQQ